MGPAGKLTEGLPPDPAVTIISSSKKPQIGCSTTTLYVPDVKPLKVCEFPTGAPIGTPSTNH